MTIPYRLIHRVMGVCLALPLLLLVVTGIPLQFTVSLGLGSAGVPYVWVHNVYGIIAPPTARISGGVSQLGEVLFIGQAHERVSGDLIGAHQLPEVLLVATSEELLLAVEEEGVPIERSALPAGTQRIGFADDTFFVDSSNGLFRSDDFGASWRRDDNPHSLNAVTWLQVADAETGGQLSSRFGAANLSWERWLQDLHSGRFFGPIGVWLMNLASFVFIFLGFTGLVLWYTTRRPKKA